MNDAYVHGYETGLNDLKIGRYDPDNVIVPVQFMNQQQLWHDGYDSSIKG